jgi:hypothetical protein
MSREPIPEHIRRYILACVSSVPYLEAMLLIRKEAEQLWDSNRVAARLYANQATVENILANLCENGVLVLVANTTPLYRYQPRSPELDETLGQLADVYAKNLVAVTDLIHSNTGKKVQQFADAFKWRKDE